jgi:excisionase family DNA binding protein
MQKKSDLISRTQAAKILGVSVRTIDRYISSDKLKVFNKSGRKWLKKTDVEAFTEQPKNEVQTTDLKEIFEDLKSYSYKIGELENKLRNSIPFTQYHFEKKQTEKTLELKNKRLETLNENVEYLRVLFILVLSLLTISLIFLILQIS